MLVGPVVDSNIMQHPIYVVRPLFRATYCLLVQTDLHKALCPSRDHFLLVGASHKGGNMMLHSITMT